MFLRGRRLPRFRWSFPPSLFEDPDAYVLVRDPCVEMGVNDTIQCAFGWSPPESDADGHGERRWIRASAQALLRSPEGGSTVRVECFAPAVPGAEALPVRVTVRDRWLWRMDPSGIYADDVIRVERGAWRPLALPLTHPPHAGGEIEVILAPDPDAVATPALAALPEHQRGLAVRRVWLA